MATKNYVGAFERRTLLLVVPRGYLTDKLDATPKVMDSSDLHKADPRIFGLFKMIKGSVG